MEGQGSSCALAVALAAILSVFFLLIFMVGVAGGFVGKSGGGAGEDTGSTFSCAGSTYKIKENGPVGEDRTPPANKKYHYGKPDDFVPLYQAAAKKYKLGPDGPSWLAGVHQTETGFGSNLNVSSAGALGHMQFMPATWEKYGVDANGDHLRNPWDAEDAIFAAARYLAASGAPDDWHRAILAYNHAEWYYDAVSGNQQQHTGIEACS